MIIKEQEEADKIDKGKTDPHQNLHIVVKVAGKLRRDYRSIYFRFHSSHSMVSNTSKSHKVNIYHSNLNFIRKVKSRSMSQEKLKKTRKISKKLPKLKCKIHA